MLGDSTVLSGGGGSGDAAAAAGGGGGGAERPAMSGGAVGSNSGDDERGRIEEGERSSFGGNRWPRQETLALLRIRSDMDVAFRDAAVKGPLWDEVSRKMAELGYHRNPKKCKEKFENVYKYHKRTKEGRSGKSDGKTYRFFDQLQALENQPPIQSPNSSKPPPQQPPPPPQAPPPQPPSLVVSTAATTAPMPPPHVSTVPSTTTPPNIPLPHSIAIATTPSMNLTNTIPSFPTSNPTNFPPSTANPTTNTTTPISFPNIPMDLLSNSTSSSTSSDETLEGRRKRKRKWKDFFERLMKEVVEKQEDLQKRFLEAIEKREHDRMAREEAWRVQEMQRINREREILAQERSIAAAKDAAVMSFLQKIAEQQNLGPALNNINTVQPQPPPPQPAVPQPRVAPPSAPTLTPALVLAPALVTQPGPPTQTQTVLAGQVIPVPQQVVTGMEIVKADNGENFTAASSSRWPKVEVEALIKLRTSLDSKYQENGPKGPLWEEISALMRNLGYNRNAKRCKEKWENINKYFKKVKESNKKRPEDSKTCPYFHQLDALYREKKGQVVVRPESTSAAPLMVQPEQQWPPQQKTTRDVTMEDAENDPMERHHEDDEGDEDYEDEDEEDEGGSGSGSGGGNYEVVASKPAAQ